MEDALDKASVYEGRCDEFDQWLVTVEAKLKAWEPLTIASQPLTRQEQELKVHIVVHTCTDLDLYTEVTYVVQACCIWLSANKYN